MDSTPPKPPSTAANSPGAITAPFDIRRSEDFFALYANNVQLEGNAFDLKLTFGILDVRNPLKPGVEQLVSINLAWPEVKVLLYYMNLHLKGYETENGNVKVPASALPPDVPSTIPPQFDNPQAREALELMRRLRAEFVDGLSKSSADVKPDAQPTGKK
jgi:hypothetical protein